MVAHKTLARRGLFLQETHELPDSDILTVGTDAVLTAVCAGWRHARKPQVPHCEERPGAAHSRRDQDFVAGWEHRKTKAPTLRGAPKSRILKEALSLCCGFAGELRKTPGPSSSRSVLCYFCARGPAPAWCAAPARIVDHIAAVRGRSFGYIHPRRLGIQHIHQSLSLSCLLQGTSRQRLQGTPLLHLSLRTFGLNHLGTQHLHLSMSTRLLRRQRAGCMPTLLPRKWWSTSHQQRPTFTTAVVEYSDPGPGVSLYEYITPAPLKGRCTSWRQWRTQHQHFSTPAPTVSSVAPAPVD